VLAVRTLRTPSGPAGAKSTLYRGEVLPPRAHARAFWCQNSKFIRRGRCDTMPRARARTRAYCCAKCAGRAVAMSGAGSNMGAAEIGCAIVIALAERGAIDPSRAVAWAEWMADNQPEATESSVAESAATTLRSFAKVLNAMVERRPSGPSGRN
jgi:hypothetical protein